MIKIVGKFLVDLKTQVSDKNISIDISDEAIDELVKQGFDRKMGARPLQRVIDKQIRSPLSREILFGSLKRGGHVHIDIVDSKITVNCKQHEYHTETEQ
jgi:ATP-dependent Clp protease ATP-binding subunit ClpA